MYKQRDRFFSLGEAMKKHLATCKELGELLRVSPETVQQWAADGRIPHYDVWIPQHLYRFNVGEVMQAMHEYKTVRTADLANAT